MFSMKKITAKTIVFPFFLSKLSTFLDTLKSEKKNKLHKLH